MTIVAAGFLLGIAASLHCAAMCGPLMSAVLHGRRGRAAVVYHGARVAVYALVGVLTGAAGQVAVLAGAGRVLSVSVGLGLIWSAAARVGWLGSRRGLNSSVGSNSSAGVSRYAMAVIARAARVVRARWSDASLSGVAAAGVLNGLLPCGPVYAALATAAALGDARLSAEFMLAFGAGTLPAVTVAGEIVGRLARTGGARWAKAVPAMLLIAGLLLTARGLMPSHHHEASSPVHDPRIGGVDSHQPHSPTPSHSASAHAAAHH
jgi:sulfite exporter TauE/SafE